MANLRRDVGKCRNVGHRLSCSSRGNENQATNVPVIYSNQSMTVTANENSKFSLLIDIYGAVFSLFRGYDELIHCEKSSHDRDLLDACLRLPIGIDYATNCRRVRRTAVC